MTFTQSRYAENLIKSEVSSQLTQTLALIDQNILKTEKRNHNRIESYCY